MKRMQTSGMKLLPQSPFHAEFKPNSGERNDIRMHSCPHWGSATVTPGPHEVPTSVLLPDAEASRNKMQGGGMESRKTSVCQRL